MLEDEIIENCSRLEIRCCACGCKLDTSAGLNIAVTVKRATWKCPVFGGFDIPDHPPRAVAIICDDCANKNKQIWVCVEFEGGGFVKYHGMHNLEDVSPSLAKLKYYFGRKMARAWKLILRAARQQSEN